MNIFLNNSLMCDDNYLILKCRSHSMWIDEVIWGHRIETSGINGIGYYQFLEFMTVVESVHRENPENLFCSTPEKPLVFRARKSLLFRGLIFNNAALTIVERNQNPNNDTEQWDSWKNEFLSSNDDFSEEDISYLQETFSSFESFANHIHLLQRLTLDISTKEVGWLSRFIFPVGVEAMYTDLDKHKNSIKTRFTRNGQLLYLMLSYSQKNKELQTAFSKIIKDSGEKNVILQKILSPIRVANPDLCNQNDNYPYLPHRRHPAYDRLADDILSLIGLDLPDQDCFEYLIPLFSFHLLLYYLETAREYNDKKGLGSIVCEIVGPRPDQVRQASITSFDANNNEGLYALETSVRNYFNTTPISNIKENDEMTEEEKKDAIRNYLCTASESSYFLWDKKKVSEGRHETLEDLFSWLIEAAKEDHKTKIGVIHKELGKECGLVSKRGTRRLRYAPTDSFLKLLVVTRVRERIELGRFLNHLYDRYHLIFGDKEAAKADDVERLHKDPFSKNTERLIRRLESMGLANRMSDGCTYIENPLYEMKDNTEE